ncbi:MAG: DUF3592 domain-containing protein [Anaerolineae bacterium]|nr:MAG: DUF3592 domain-containing protein [Anaerolineae bacterium]
MYGSARHVVVLVWGIVETQNYLALKNEGVTVVGEWVSRRMSTDSDGNDTYFVTYAFTVRDRQYVHEQSVSAERYNRYEKGGRVTVLDLPYNPDVAKIEGTNALPWPLFIFSAVWLSFSFFFIWLIRRQ